MTQSWPAPAKINLFLHITGRRQDGYHELQTVFQFLDIADELHFTIRQDGGIHRLTDLPGVTEEADLVVRAAKALQQHTGSRLGVDISVRKVLPMGGGLGGGSSNAATTLVALNQLWQTGLSEDELARLGLGLGADVPVFIRGRTAWAEGVGENLQPLELPEKWFLVLIPPVNVSTAIVFSDSDLTRDCPPMTIRHFLSGQGKNVCEPVVRRAYPAVAEALDWLARYGDARMTGTGACVFAAFDSETRAREVLAELPADWQGFVARGLNRSPLANM